MATLPSYAKFMSEDYAETVDYRVMRTEMDAGIAKQRAGRTKPIRTRKGTLLIDTLANKSAFEAWLASIGNGVGWFDYTDPFTGNIKKCRFINENWEFKRMAHKVWVAACEMESIG